MVFSSMTFLLLFLPAALLLYYAAPRKLKNGILFLCSLVFYAWGEPVYVVIMLFSTALDYTCGRLVERYRGTKKQKIGLILSICVNVGLLAFFKYTDFFIGTVNSVFGAHIGKLGLPLPIGISFYTFQTMSYTADVYRGEAKVQKNIITFGAYVSMFPQLIAGPIVRYRDVAEQLDGRVHTADRFGDGVKRFVTGLGKKVLLANNIGMLWDAISSTDPANLSAVGAWLGMIAFAFQIYFDFSGYSDMAIGLGKMFGFDFPENFDHPYVSRSVTEFWRRWHISLGRWFRDYVYIPLGGNRRGLPVQLRNVAVVWLLTGFWHGASWNFVLWGVYYGVLLILEKLFLLKLLDKMPRALRHLYTLFAVLVGWALFAFDDLGAGMRYLGAMFGAGAGFVNAGAMYYLLSYLPLILLCAAASTPLFTFLYRKFSEKCGEGPTLALDTLRVASFTLLSMAYIVSGTYNPFLYFRF